jgi:hypothetical protein
MTKQTQIKEIQKRLPDNIKIVDETLFDFTEDEFVSILCWIKYFNQHYEQYGKNEYPKIMFPIISKRLRLDFGLYRVKSDIGPFKGCYNIYLSENGKGFPDKIKMQSVKYLIQIRKL